MREFEERLGEVPESLRTRMADAMNTQGAGRGAQGAKLKAVAEALLWQAKACAVTHETAMTLLTADALITYACEVVAEVSPGKLGEMG